MRPYLVGLLVLVGSTMVGGCFAARSGFATPAYSGHERGQMIARNQNNEWRQVQDDTDTLLLLRPGGTLTLWNVR